MNIKWKMYFGLTRREILKLLINWRKERREIDLISKEF